MPPPEKPLPKPPKPKPPKPKPKKLKTGPAAADTKPMPERDVSPINGGVPSLPHPFSATSCSTYPLCPPPPSPPATVHLRSARLPTPLIAVSASLLALSAVLLLALLIRWLVRRCLRGQQQQHAQQDQEAPLAPDDGDDESVLGVDTTAWGAEEGEEVDSGDVHHVWFIRTKGLDERAIAAIAAVVYDASSKGKSRSGGAGEDGDGCAVCLAEFRDGETLRLLPRCGHAFHRGCIDTWLRAHVNCPLCRAPVQVHVTDKAGATAAWVHSQAVAEAANHRGAPTEPEEAERVVAAERAVRRAASMVTIPRRAWPDVAVQLPPASSSAREEDMTGLTKIRRLLKLSDALAGVGRSMSFGAGTCQRLPTRSGPSTAAAGGVNGGDEIESSR